jgi:glycosyltransferase involved in cell wall biosynthesis
VPASARDVLKAIAERAPVARSYLQLRRLRRITESQAATISRQTDAISQQADAISGQADAIKRLEARNDEWAAEVRALRRDDEPMHIIWPARKEDIVAANWHTGAELRPLSADGPPYTLNWVVPPMGQASGGTATLFRTISYLESRGHKCRVYFYDARNMPTFAQVKEAMAEYPPIAAALSYNATEMAACDAIFATNWISAYPVLAFAGASKKFYYVQDFEPYFEPAGTYSALAANTYRFGFHGVTIGEWLANKLEQEYDMTCDAVDLAVDAKHYSLRQLEPRDKVLFYARPVSPRRGFELGVLALECFHGMHPEYEIELVGWDIDRYELSFPHHNNGVLGTAELCELYNKCAAGLVLSFTNMSLLPLEMLACGCLPVINDAPHTRLVNYADDVHYSEPTPTALAEALYDAICAGQRVGVRQKVAAAANALDWERSNQRIEQILLRELAARSPYAAQSATTGERL